MSARTGIYTRISDDPEGRRLGVERQGEDTRALCKRDGDEVVDGYCDNDISASTRSKKPRPDYRRLLADARSGRINKIVAYTSGRLTRRPRELEDQIELAEQFGVVFKYVASPSFDLNTSAGRRIARILAANDAGEAEDIGERVARERQQKAEGGYYTGSVRPFGFEADGIEHRPDEAATIRDIVHRLLAGETVTSVVADLNERGVPTTKGNQWARMSLRRMLMRPRNAGLSVYRGEVIGPARWRPVVDEADWQALVSLLLNPDRRRSSSNELARIGIGLFLCGKCAEPTAVESGTTKSRKPAYRCPTRHLSRVVDPVDSFVGELVIERLERPDALDLLDEGREELAPLRRQLATVRSRLDEQARLHAQGVIDGRQLVAGTRLLRSESSDLESRIAAATAGSALAGVADAEDVRAAWEGLSMGRRRSVVAALMEVTILPAGKLGRQPGGDSWFDPDSVRADWKR
jgi:site-specific DNA recombinase